MARKKETLTLSVPPGTKEKLEDIARHLDIKWGDNPSASGLVAAIAQNEVQVSRNRLTLNAKQIKALRQASKVLLDAGQVEDAETLIALLLDQENLETPLRQALVQQMNQPLQSARNQVDEYIRNQQPFRLSYQNSQGQELEFTVRYAEVRLYEKRFYLQVWCDETEDSEDVPELRHNRCFRLDRIEEEGILPIEGEWRGSLDSIKVYLHFKGWLANAYEPKPEDLENEFLGEIRQVVRRVVNPFWLIREVFRYGKDCEIVAPDAVRSRFKAELRKLCQDYGLEMKD